MSKAGRPSDSPMSNHAESEYFEGIWRRADTAILGRTTYEGFFSVWPQITRDPATDPRTPDLGTWLDTVEKVVASRTWNAVLPGRGAESRWRLAGSATPAHGAVGLHWRR
jgi:hypothetical protein